MVRCSCRVGFWRNERFLDGPDTSTIAALRLASAAIPFSARAALGRRIALFAGKYTRTVVGGGLLLVAQDASAIHSTSASAIRIPSPSLVQRLPQSRHSEQN